MKRALIVAIVFLFLASGVVTSVYMFASGLAAPALGPVGAPPPDLPIESVVIERREGAPVYGWFAEGDPSAGGVLLLHGVRGDRRQMMERARFLHDAGYSVLAIDLQAHGETLGERITFGYLESYDARAAMSYLRTRVADRPVGVIGNSLGGATVLLGPRPLQADAVVLEAVFSTLEQAVENRMALYFGDLGVFVTPLLLVQVPPRLDIPLEALAPISAIGRLDAPVLIISGTDDVHTLESETRALYAQAKEPKSLWMVEGARHQDLYNYAPAEYRERVLAFFDRYL